MSRLLWTLKQHVGPPPRVAHAFAFDARRRRAILFGGDSLNGELFQDTWEWDGENWTQMSDIGPSSRFDATMVFDTSRNRAVLFGGLDAESRVQGDTWEWDGNDWTQTADDGPPARYGHAMAFDAEREVVVLFGGAGENGQLGDTWEWNGDEWVQVENGGPAPRAFHAMTFDTARHRVVLFGGRSGTSPLGDTWELDGEGWTQVADFGPPPCFGASLHFSGRRSRLFGGASGVTGDVEIFHRTWEWDGRHWTIRQDLGPGPRWKHAMVFDTSRRRGVLFGGTASLPGVQTQAPSGDTWEQFDQGATEAEPGPQPEAAVSGVVRDYFTRAPLASVTLTVGNQPGLSTISDADGNYAFARAGAAPSFAVIASRAGHLETWNDLGPVGAAPIVADVFLVTAADLARQVTSVGATQLPETGAVFIDLVDDAGQPRQGVPAANIRLENILRTVGGLGPFFFGATDLDGNLTEATTFNGRSRAAFLNVAPGLYILRLTTADPQPTTLTTDVTVRNVTLTRR